MWYVCCLCRLAERERSLQNAINAMYRFDSDLKNCSLWLTKVEVVLNHHNEVTSDVSKLDEKQLDQICDAVRVCILFLFFLSCRLQPRSATRSSCKIYCATPPKALLCGKFVDGETASQRFNVLRRWAMLSSLAAWFITLVTVTNVLTFIAIWWTQECAFSRSFVNFAGTSRVQNPKSRKTCPEMAVLGQNENSW